MIPHGWPPVDDVNTLVEKSSSHFIYAFTAMKYIGSPRDNPVRSLQVVLGLQVSRSGPPFADLDALYHHILGSAAHIQRVRQILALCIFSILPPFLSVISHMLGCPYNDVTIFLFDMAALVQVRKADFGLNGVRVLHASLGDFLRNQSRSQGLYIDESAFHASSVARCFALLDLFSHCKDHIEPKWSITYCPTGYDYSLLGKQIFLSIAKLGGSVDARRLLSQYSLQAFHDRIIRFSPYVDFFGIPESILNYMEAVRLAGINDEGHLYKVMLEQFFDILQSYLEQDIGQLAHAILPLIFSGYPLATVREIVFHHGGQRSSSFQKENTSYLLMCGTPSMHNREHVLSVFDNLNIDILGSLRHSVNASAEGMAVAAQVMLEYASTHLPSPAFSEPILFQTPHQLWLRRKKPGKHIAMGSPWLASAFHRQYRDYRLKAKPLPYQYSAKQRQNYLDLLPESCAKHSQRDMCNFLVLNAIPWVLSRAAHRDELLSYTSMTFSKAVYRRCPKLARKVLRCLDMYNADVRKDKLSVLAKRIDNGSPNALMESTRFYDLDLQD